VYQLTQTLGAGQDIAALQDFLLNSADKDVTVEGAHIQMLLPLMEHRQNRLHRDANELGQRIYCEDPSAFIHRIAGYWQSWFAPKASGQTPNA
ncbi:MAG: hypothetical protein WBB18_17790, partial [Nodosilinea sp.]